MWLKTTPTTAMLCFWQLQEMPVTLARLSLCSAPDGVSLQRDLDTVECDFVPILDRCLFQRLCAIFIQKLGKNDPMKSGII